MFCASKGKKSTSIMIAMTKWFTRQFLIHFSRFLFLFFARNMALNTTVRQVFRNEQRYYELLVDKSVTSLSLFPYHLADIITKGLRVTPFNYYIDVLSYLLKNDRSYDTLPNFTAADCMCYWIYFKECAFDDYFVYIICCIQFRFTGAWNRKERVSSAD